jgi:hypothetical protein
MTVPTESVVIANMANMANTSAFSSVELPAGRRPSGCVLSVGKMSLEKIGHDRVGFARFRQL